MTALFDRDVWSVLGIPIDNLTLAEAAAQIERAVKDRTRLSFVTPNVNWLVRALRDDAALQQIRRADLSLADGAPIVWLARQVGMPLKERVAGSDLFEYLRRDVGGNGKPIRVFFFGGRDGAAQAACEQLEKENGRLQPVGWHNPGFGSVADMTTADIQAKINRAAPDFIIVALGAAKGQAWIEANLAALDAPVIAHLGAVVDFVAGTIERAPSWVSQIGLEWVWRIFAEPSLWKRYWQDGKALLSLTYGRLRPLKKLATATPGPVPFEFTHAREEGRLVLALSGDLTRAGDSEIRNAFQKALAADLPVHLDLAQIGRIDAAGLGLTHLLQHALLWRDQPLTLQAPPPIQQALKAASLA